MELSRFHHLSLSLSLLSGTPDPPHHDTDQPLQADRAQASSPAATAQQATDTTSPQIPVTAAEQAAVAQPVAGPRPSTGQQAASPPVPAQTSAAHLAEPQSTAPNTVEAAAAPADTSTTAPPPPAYSAQDPLVQQATTSQGKHVSPEKSSTNGRKYNRG